MGRSEAATLDSLGPDADSPLRQPRRFFSKLLLGAATLGAVLLPFVVALMGQPWALLLLLPLALGITWIKWKRPSALDAVLRTTWHFVIVPQWREGREHLSSLEEAQKVVARCIQVLALLGLGALAACHAFQYHHAAEPPIGTFVPGRAVIGTKVVGTFAVGTTFVDRPAAGCATLNRQVRSASGYWLDELVFEPADERCRGSVRAGTPPSSVRTVINWVVEKPASLFQLLLLLFKVTFALGAAFASLAAVPVAAVRALAGLTQTALGIGEGLLLGLAWLRTPVPHVIPRDEPSSQARLILCQLSDVHLSVNEKPPVELGMGEASWPEPTLPDGKAMMARLSRLLRAADAIAPELIAITGDLTDTGAIEEWDNAEAAFRDAELQSPVFLIPGNHDLCFNPIESPDLDRSRTAARRELFLERAARIERGPWAIRPGRKWRQVFPRRHTTESGVHLFAFDTNGYGSRQTLSNAVGIFGSHALTHLERELAGLTGPVVVMAHHHVGRPLERSLGKDPFLIAVDARALLDILCRYNARDPERNGVLVVHGHRHLDALTRYENHRGRVDIYSHPSSTLGYENDGHLDGVARFASVWLDPKGRWVIKSHAVEAVEVRAAPAQVRVA